MRFWPHFCLVAALLGASSQVQNDPRACLVPRPAGETASTHAVKCAEEFIRRNGYTGLAPTVDSLTMAHEGIVFEPTIAQELQGRRNSLEDHATGLCPGSPRDSSGFTIVFRSPKVSGSARAVTMDRQFGGLRVEHQAFILDVVTKRKYGCRPGRSF
jgi:hypothetical protein